MKTTQSPILLNITPQQALWEGVVNSNFNRIESFVRNPLPIAAYVSDLPDPAAYAYCLAVVLPANAAGKPRLMISDGTQWLEAVHSHRQKISVLFSTATPSGTDYFPHPTGSLALDETGESSISGNQILLPAGNYTVNGYGRYSGFGPHSCRLWDASGSEILVDGMPCSPDRTQDSRSWLIGAFSLESPASVEFQHYAIDFPNGTLRESVLDFWRTTP